MPEYTLEELKKRSGPALRNAELVRLAGDNMLSPSKVYEIAALSHSERLAKAARFLAIVRRDFGAGVFNDLANNNAPEPAPKAGHVQEKKMQNSNTVLSRIKDPATRIHIMVNNRMAAELEQELNRLPADKWEIYFEGNHGDPILRSELLAFTEKKSDPLYPYMLTLRDPDTFYDHRFDAHNDHPAIRIHLVGLFDILGWDDTKKTMYIWSIIGKTIMREPTVVRSSVAEATLAMAKLSLGDLFDENSDSECFRWVEKWFLLAKLRTGRVFEMRQHLVTAKEPDPNKLIRAAERKTIPYENELVPTVNRLKELGMSMEGIREEILRIIRLNVENCRPEFMLALTGAKCFPEGDTDRDAILSGTFLPGMWKDEIHGLNGPDNGWLNIYCRLLKFVSQKPNPLFYRSEFVDWVSQGFESATIKALANHAEKLGLGPMSEEFPALLPFAFNKAIAKGHVGTAVALYDKYGDACFGPRPESSDAAKQERQNLIVDLRRFAKSIGQETKLQ